MGNADRLPDRAKETVQVTGDVVAVRYNPGAFGGFLAGQADAVRQLVIARARAGSRPGQRTDAARIALCIEGGAMRGVISAGMVVAIQQLGLVHAFDAVYGSSAGAMNGAYMLAGQAPFGTTVYYEDINNRNFIDFGRPLHGRSIVDLDFLVDDVMNRRKRLDVDAVRRSPVPLHMLATHVSSGDRHVFSSWTDRNDFLHGLRAGASMPILAGPPYAYRDTHYWDALLTEPIPVRTAEASGFSHIVALLTRPRGHGGPRMSLVERLVILPRMRAVSPDLADRYETRGLEYAELVQGVWRESGPDGRAAVLPIAPSSLVVGKVEKRREVLVEGAIAGALAVFDGFGFTRPRLVETLGAVGEDGQLAVCCP